MSTDTTLRDELIDKFQREQFLEIAFDPRFFESDLSDPVAENVVATAFSCLGAFEDAITRLRALAAAHPDYVQAKNNLGLAYLAAGRLDEAIDTLRQVVSAAPDFADAHNNLSVAYFEAEKYDKAVVWHERALDLDPQNTAYKQNLADTLGRKGDVDQALMTIKEILAVRPDDVDTRIQLASMMLNAGQYGSAAVEFERLVSQGIKSSYLYRALTVLFARLGEYEKVIIAARAALDLDPASVEMLLITGISHYSLGDNAQAAHFLDAAAEISPSNPEVQYFQGVLEGNQDPVVAEAYAKRLFDTYSTSFDESLVGQLKYDAPNLIADLLTDLLGPDLGRAIILDMGCGTGLVGAALSGSIERIDGIDISPRMLDQARKKQVYDRLSVRSISAALTKDISSYDVFVAADVFIYVGDLRDVFSMIASNAESGSWFVFTTEVSYGQVPEMTKTGRVAHPDKYIEDLAEQYDFARRSKQKMTLRFDRGQPVDGRLFVLQKT